ncbi:MAG: InlB B-repeat-containing protein [Rhodoluna sp.]|nr:InlB B-repeat-containing protein [Rhodoluna sp.]MBP6186482.1 InlB B-repeat-containing protein [Rhodoluna sp.]
MRLLTALLVGLLSLTGLQALEISSAPKAQAAVLNLDAPVISSITSPAGNQLTVNFTAPTNPSALSISNYQVEYSTNGSSWTVASSTVASNATSYTITGLTPSTAYYVRIAANSGGLGSYGYDWKKIYSTSTQTRDGNQQIVYDSGFGLGGSDAAVTYANANYSRIRYLMKATYSGVNNYVDANFSKSMSNVATSSESFTTSANLDYLRVPTSDNNNANRFEIQGDVTDLTVLSNVANVENGSEYSGRLEIWPWNYDIAPNTGLSSTRSSGIYDDGDSWNSTGDYGSFQLHRLSAESTKRRTIFAWNRHMQAGVAEIGFGDNTNNTHSDWTFANQFTYPARTNFSLGVYINATTTTLSGYTVTYSINGATGAVPSQTAHINGTVITLPTASAFSKPGYNFGGWTNGTTTYLGGAPYTVTSSNVTLTAVWTSALIVDYDVTDTNSYTSGTTLTNRNSAYTNATLSSSSIFNRTSQALNFGSGTFATAGSINAGTFSSGLTIDIYGSLGSDSANGWERFIDFAKLRPSSSYANDNYNLDVGRYYNTNKIFLEIFNQNSGASSIGHCMSNTDQLDNLMHRYTFVLNGSSCSLYVDGAQVQVINSFTGNAASSISYGLPLNVTWDNNLIAKSNWAHLGDSPTSGAIRSIRMLNNASTPATIDLIDSGRLVYKSVSYSSPESATLPATDVTTGTLRLPLASTATRAGFALNNWYTTSARSLVAAAPGGDYAITSSTTLHAGWTGAASAQSALSVTSTSGTFGSSLTLSTSGGSGSGAVTYSVSNGTAAGCSISGSTLSFTSVGTCLVTATKAADASYLVASSAATTVTIAAKPVTVTGSNRSISFAGSLTPGYTAGAMAGSDAISTVTYTYQGTGSTTYGPSATAPTAVGTYSITPAVSALSVGTLSNYNFASTAGTLTIGLATLAEPTSISSGTTPGVLKSIGVWWSSVTNATSYTVKFNTGGVDIFTVDVVGTSTTVADARFVNGAAYLITVRANGTGNYASSPFSTNSASSWANSIYTLTYVYNGADGANGTATSTWIPGAAAIVLPTPTKTNYTFAGWYSNAGLTVSVTGDQTPFADETLYAKWTASHYSVNYSPNYGASVSSVASVAVGVATVLPTPVRANFVFDGWYTAATGGTKVGNAGANYTPTQNVNLFARWIQASLYGIAPGNLSRVGTLTANDIVSTGFNGTLGNNAVTVTLPNATLPAGTIVSLDLITDTTYAQTLLSGNNTYLLSLAVSWLAPDETVPNTNNGKSVSMTIVNPTIKAGALVYSIQSGTVQLLGTALIDGSITVQLTSDPAVYVVSTVPRTPVSITTSVTESSAVVTWTAPSANGGSVITGYTVTLSDGATCTTTLLTCAFLNLTAGTTYTAVVVASNAVGNSISASTTFTPAGVIVTPPVIVPPVPPVTPVPPVIPEEPPVIPQKPIITQVPVLQNVVSVLANNVAVLAGTKIAAPVLFKPNSTSLSASALAQIKVVAESMKDKKGTFLVTGFVYYTNVSKSVMKKIATLRAKTVSLQLSKLGIKANIGFVGYGANNTKSPRSTDRKVELRWVADK